MPSTVADAITAPELRAATRQAALFANDAGILRLTGEDARDLLNRLSTNLIDPGSEPGTTAVTVLTSDRGRIVDLVYVVHCGDHQLLLTSPGQQQNVINFLDKYTIMEDLDVADITDQTGLLTLTGPRATEILRQTPHDGALVIQHPPNPDDPHTQPTYHLLIDDADAASRIAAAMESGGAISISAGSAEALRIIQGRPAYGSEMSDAYNPLEAGLIGVIDFHKGCYIGQEVIARLDTYQKVQKYLVSLQFEAADADVNTAYSTEGIVAALPGVRLNDDEGKAMGLVTSAALRPTPAGDDLIGLGYVRTAAAQLGRRLNLASDGEASGFVAIITGQPQFLGGEKQSPGA